jgi:hypothetical protein
MMLAAKKAALPVTATYVEAAGLCEHCARKDRSAVSAPGRRETASLELVSFD